MGGKEVSGPLSKICCEKNHTPVLRSTDVQCMKTNASRGLLVSFKILVPWTFIDCASTQETISEATRLSHLFFVFLSWDCFKPEHLFCHYLVEKHGQGPDDSGIVSRVRATVPATEQLCSTAKATLVQLLVLCGSVPVLGWPEMGLRPPLGQARSVGVRAHWCPWVAICGRVYCFWLDLWYLRAVLFLPLLAFISFNKMLSSTQRRSLFQRSETAAQPAPRPTHTEGLVFDEHMIHMTRSCCSKRIPVANFQIMGGRVQCKVRPLLY